MLAETITAVSLCIQTHTSVVLTGGPGVGKTVTLTAIGKALDLPTEVVIASIREPSDFAGLPIVTRDGVKLCAPTFIHRLVAAGKGLLFLDEISTAPPATQAALLRGVLDRTFGDVTLPDEVSIIAAMNPPHEAAGGWDLTAPLANRFCHLTWVMDPAAWADGMVSGWPLPDVRRLPDNWIDHLPLARALVAAFAGRARPSLLYQLPKDESQQGHAWPSPRSWTMAAPLMAACWAMAVSREIEALLIAGCVGDGPTLEFLQWRQELDLPDPEELLADPMRLKLPARGDRAYAVLASVIAAVLAKNTVDRWARGWQVVAHATATGQSDVAAVAARALATNRPKGATIPKEAGAFFPLLKAAGLL